VVLAVYVAGWVAFGADLAGEDPGDSTTLKVMRLLDCILGHAAIALFAASNPNRTWVRFAIPATLVLSSFAVPVALVALFRCAAAGRGWSMAGLTLAAFASHSFLVDPLAGSPLTRSEAVFNILSEAFVVGVAATAGWVMGIRRNEREAWVEARRADAVLRERSRIAREMHDSLAHRLTIVALHSAALAQREDLPEAVRRSSANIIHSGVHEALDELRVTLGSLRSVAATEAPQPEVGDLDALIADARRSGQKVEVAGASLLHDTELVPAPLGRHIYRIVQESLTNARKHSPDLPVLIEIDGVHGESLHLRVSNPTGPLTTHTRSGTGFGLMGMAERVSLLGGTLTTGRIGSEFVVDVVVPWPAETGGSS